MLKGIFINPGTEEERLGQMTTTHPQSKRAKARRLNGYWDFCMVFSPQPLLNQYNQTLQHFWTKIQPLPHPQGRLSSQVSLSGKDQYYQQILPLKALFWSLFYTNSSQKRFLPGFSERICSAGFGLSLNTDLKITTRRWQRAPGDSQGPKPRHFGINLGKNCAQDSPLRGSHHRAQSLGLPWLPTHLQDFQGSTRLGTPWNNPMISAAIIKAVLCSFSLWL